jgi:hypothetical protein
VGALGRDTLDRGGRMWATLEVGALEGGAIVLVGWCCGRFTGGMTVSSHGPPWDII